MKHRQAIAIYENVSECVNELSFNKGDTLTVLNDDISGLKGWWLCSLKGVKGIAPANRLRLIQESHVGYSCNTSPSPSSSSSSSSSSLTLSSNNTFLVSSQKPIFCGSSQSIKVNQEKLSSNETDIYDVPNISNRIVDYDIPKSCRQPQYSNLEKISQKLIPSYDVPNFSTIEKRESDEAYDIPISTIKSNENYYSQKEISRFHESKSNSSSAIKAESKSSLIAPSSNSLSIEALSLTNFTDPNKSNLDQSSENLNSQKNPDVLYDVPKNFQENSKEIKIYNVNDALEYSSELEDNINGYINKLLNVTKDNWRSHCNIKANLETLRENILLLRDSLQKLVEFGKLMITCSSKSPERSLNLKLSKIVMQLKDSFLIIDSALKKVNAKGWTFEAISLNGTVSKDELDQIIAVIRGLSQDVNHFSSFVKNNGKNILKTPTNFKPPIAPRSVLRRTLSAKATTSFLQERALPLPPQEKKNEKQDFQNLNLSILDQDYEYVSFDKYEKKSDTFSGEKHNIQCMTLGVPEKEILDFYSPQIDSHIRHLLNAINSLLRTMETNQPPKLFIGQSKLVLIAAQRLTYICEALNRNIGPRLSEKLTKHNDALSQTIKGFICDTKKAMRLFPSVTAVHEMTEKLIQISVISQQIGSLFR